MTAHDQHSSFIKNWKQLVVVVSLSFLIPIILIVFLTQLVTNQFKPTPADDSAALARIKPVGEVVLAEASGPVGQKTGEQVFQQVCKTCHEAGLAGAPKFGDKAAWAHVIAQGRETTMQHAVSGIRAMPAKGGNPDLTNEEVQRAVAYMANAVGTKWAAPEVAAAGQQATATPAQPAAGAPQAPAVAAAAAAPAAATTAAAAGKPDGKKIYESTCTACHAAGLVGAPKFGDKAAWAPRIKEGLDALHANALKGKNAMPPKGGNTTLSDAEVAAAVDYMVSAAR